jgi:ribosomal protein L11 methylase PrmA
MLREAALLTLGVQADAMAAGITLRDASAFNVLFDGVRPVLIDHLSFEPATPGAPWTAYRQFCEHFLAPLALMARRDVRLGSSLLRAHLDGIPLDLAARLLPWRTRLSPGLAPHVHLHARSQRRHEAGGAGVAREAGQARVGKLGGEALVDSLRRTVEGLRWTPSGTEWADYEAGDGADEATRAASAAKDAIVRSMLEDAGGTVVWDLGANVGRHTAIATDLGRRVVAWDADPAAVERHFRALRGGPARPVLPLLADLADPTPAVGWALRERRSMLERADADVVLALALVHHLALGRNVPLERIADLFATLAGTVIVEWVGRDDPMVGRLLATREDVFRDYGDAGFRAAFERRFRVVEERPLPGTARILFRMERYP